MTRPPLTLPSSPAIDSPHSSRGWPKTTVLVVGDVMLDRYLMGDVERISPEAPVPVVTVADERVVPGGAANVAANLAALGAAPRLLGADRR